MFALLLVGMNNLLSTIFTSQLRGGSRGNRKPDVSGYLLVERVLTNKEKLRLIFERKKINRKKKRIPKKPAGTLSASAWRGELAAV